MKRRVPPQGYRVADGCGQLFLPAKETAQLLTHLARQLEAGGIGFEGELRISDASADIEARRTRRNRAICAHPR